MSPTQKVGFLAGNTPFTERMAAMPANALITVKDPTNAAQVQLQVKTAETLYPLRRYGTPEWKRSGDQWQALLCVSGDPSWSKTDVLLVVIGDGQYLFNDRTPLGSEGSGKIAPYAQKFDHDHNQEPGSVSMPYQGRDFAIQDIGKWQISAQTGDSHFPSSDNARFLVAHGPDNTAILVEDDETGSANDSVWSGWRVEFDRVVAEVLTPTGK